MGQEIGKTDLAELRRLHEAAMQETSTPQDLRRSMNAAYLALPALLDELEAAQEELRRLTQAVGDLRTGRARAVKEAQRQDGVAKGLRKERDQLRDKLSVMKEYIDSFEKILDKAGVPKSDSVGDPLLWNERVELLAEQNTALAADNARLRAALDRAFEGAARQLAEPRHHGNDQYALTDIATTCELALAATPAQPLAAHDAEVKVAVLREMRNKMYYAQTWDEIANMLADEADRIEQEAANGKTGS